MPHHSLRFKYYTRAKIAEKHWLVKRNSMNKVICADANNGKSTHTLDIRNDAAHTAVCVCCVCVSCQILANRRKKSTNTHSHPKSPILIIFNLRATTKIGTKFSRAHRTKCDDGLISHIHTTQHIQACEVFYRQWFIFFSGNIVALLSTNHRRCHLFG